MFKEVSNWVARNLDCAQYAQPRGSQYEGRQPLLSEDGWDQDRDLEEFVNKAREAREAAEMSRGKEW